MAGVESTLIVNGLPVHSLSAAVKSAAVKVTTPSSVPVLATVEATGTGRVTTNSSTAADTPPSPSETLSVSV